MKVIQRDMYLKRLIDRKENGSIKVITGLKRSGKSFLLFSLYKDYLLKNGVNSEQIIEIPLDDDLYEEFRERKTLRKYIENMIVNHEQYYLFLDEVQMCDGFEGVLNGLARKSNLDIYVTGSNSKFLSTDILTEFRGRGDEVRVYPLSFSEYFSAYSGNEYEAFNEYLMYGGLPQVLSRDTSEQKSSYLKALIQRTYLRDIIERNRVKNDAVLEDVMEVLASSVGSLTNPTKLTKTFLSNGIKTSDKTIRAYISYLQDAFLIDKAERYNVKGRKYIGSPSKFYYTDIGLRNAMLNFRQNEATHLMENIVYNELILRGYNVDVGVVEVEVSDSGVRKRKTLEIDFVCNLESDRVYIQSAYSVGNTEKMNQESASLNLVDDSFKKVIVTNDLGKSWHTENGYTVMNIIDFLLDKDSLKR